MNERDHRHSRSFGGLQKGKNRDLRVRRETRRRKEEKNEDKTQVNVQRAVPIAERL